MCSSVRHSRIFSLLAFFLFPLLTMAQRDVLFSSNRDYQTMSQRWELDADTRRGTFLITPYKPVYFTAGRRSDNPNEQPVSENPAYSQPTPIAYNNYECKFQLSFKTKIIEGMLNHRADLWVGYTQKAHWQIYNQVLSRPFRELNYEPEVIFNVPVNIPVLGLHTRMLSVIFNHQSNGRSLPLSRSWNRIIFQAGFERKDWQVFLRPWIRLHDKDDENPAITDYIGRGEAVVVRNLGKHQLSVIGSHSLRFGNKFRGSLQANWVFPVLRNVKVQAQFTHGYGETLVDYNHSQTTFGLSISFLEW